MVVLAIGDRSVQVEAVPIVHVSVEIAPWSRKGGLGDAVAGLTKALARGQHNTVFSPLFSHTRVEAEQRPLTSIVVDGSAVPVTVSAWYDAGRSIGFVQLPFPHAFDDVHTDATLVHQEGLDPRYLMFGEAVARMLAKAPRPGVCFTHDWHGGAIHLFRNLCPGWTFIHVIHNFEYQGPFSWGGQVAQVLGERQSVARRLVADRAPSMAALAVGGSHRVVTVSPTYATELTMGTVAHPHLDLLADVEVTGLLNGYDNEIWDPMTDPLIVGRYGGPGPARRHNRQALESALGLVPGRTLVVLVSRLIEQKGIDLLVGSPPSAAQAARRIAAVVSTSVNLAVCGDPDGGLDGRLHHVLLNAARRHRGRFAYHAGYDEQIGHRMLAAADLLMHPSRFEPCGLTQLHALAYGAVPIVNPVGGLRDTVADNLDPTLGPIGVHLSSLSLDSVVAAIRRCIDALHSTSWDDVIVRAMAQPRSWSERVDPYLALIKSVRDDAGRGGPQAGRGPPRRGGAPVLDDQTAQQREVIVRTSDPVTALWIPSTGAAITCAAHQVTPEAWRLRLPITSAPARWGLVCASVAVDDRTLAVRIPIAALRAMPWVGACVGPLDFDPQSPMLTQDRAGRVTVKARYKGSPDDKLRVVADRRGGEVGYLMSDVVTVGPHRYLQAEIPPDRSSGIRAMAIAVTTASGTVWWSPSLGLSRRRTDFSMPAPEPAYRFASPDRFCELPNRPDADLRLTVRAAVATGSAVIAAPRAGAKLIDTLHELDMLARQLPNGPLVYCHVRDLLSQKVLQRLGGATMPVFSGWEEILLPAGVDAIAAIWDQCLEQVRHLSGLRLVHGWIVDWADQLRSELIVRLCEVVRSTSPSVELVLDSASGRGSADLGLRTTAAGRRFWPTVIGIDGRDDSGEAQCDRSTAESRVKVGEAWLRLEPTAFDSWRPAGQVLVDGPWCTTGIPVTGRDDAPLGCSNGQPPR